MAPRKKAPPKVRRIRVIADCPFCKADKDPDYKDYGGLKKYLSERARIIGKEYTGVCSKHQRRLSKEIKRARQIGLLPITPSI
ncbi:30S ribosomal protein S18 [Candidatus Woesebacteria bacterium RIFCSPLOWO2_01_FULL_39_61]|uniref:Small ribosomal subunit protein bS18 n=1 Tax=Candidatus Woesebacteria bacterium RIFCSPHIGHO2_02_FULL_39_13 TaxID=1802505 RepID=A0A1F7Z102_9BACT|nr:MAG: 30S ribosomal protein S18 [Candidatus Woesebacteria bacterium RIFCSPHIGHO2_01_FULL_39_95]OGM33273.1 MAG: 30S ribosomal protein S18 [Candidatus Woesebacteria bacterium RIFCSPHIGHO2_02_FULL_39_13]OGM38445.1 MAG: 30S ribosomal protein S18 [Candidatus Woesebacteria bacterium RIFCSPHIGHO2_12_FULL_40_20]OGM66883.1 MAG: 30S ribosomal protein S18 [Candidatus Woesebacteria bacterium RIFCSPLOWO2_01_FULL_39_61]OGM75322.1 MAG: 30S ribosomal protein S18 [Candidatus Woesebacteria bacterium RIFCSPLOWO